jgi:hypothetical protein
MMRKLVLTFALLAAALPSAAAAADLPRGFIGVSPQNPANAADFELMREAGISSVRLPLYWHGTQTKSPYLADPGWRGFDREVAIAARAEIRIMPFVFGTPSWAAEEPIVLPVETPLQRWGWVSFLRAAVDRYGAGGEFWKEHPELPYLPFKRWEIWNEQNIVTWSREQNPAKFAMLLRMSGRVLRRADPGAEAIIGGFFGRPLQIPPNLAAANYLDRIYAAGNVKRWFDGVGLHPYVARAGAMKWQIEGLRRVMRAHGDARTPIYVTELGWGSNPGPTRWERGLRGQARELDRAFSMISANRARWRVGGLWWFTWSDEGGSCSFCSSSGLLTADRKAKPSWYRFNRWTGGDAGVVPKLGSTGPKLAGG